MTKKLFVSILEAGTGRSWHMSFNGIDSFKDYCKLYDPSKTKEIDNCADPKELCYIMSNWHATFHCDWQK